jgi:hypothetical protein
VLASVGAAFALCLAVALALDSVRALRGARSDLAEADRELRLHEERLVSIMDGVPDAGQAVHAATAAWARAEDRTARHAAYRTLATTARHVAAIEGRLGDQIAGALNRHDIAQRRYDDAEALCQSLASTSRGHLAAALMRVQRPCAD